MWSRVQFPKDLQTISLTWGCFKDILLSPSLNCVSISCITIRDFSLLRNKFSPNLTSLTLESNQLGTLVIDDLPDALRELFISTNQIRSIKGKMWPQGLEVLELNHACFSNSRLTELIQTRGWPGRLWHLRINRNSLTQTEILRSLPPTLKYLDISSNPWVWDYGIEFRFPCNLTKLRMFNYQIHELTHFQFPTSLVELELTKNIIRNLLSYAYWDKLTNLRYLRLKINLIDNLDGWTIPPNLKLLQLSWNPIQDITSSFPLFDSRYKFRLVLELNRCPINKIKLDYYPPSLKRFAVSQYKSFTAPTGSTIQLNRSLNKGHQYETLGRYGSDD